MKTLKSLTTALLIILSFSAFASGEKSAPIKSFPLPTFVWGSAEDLDLNSVEFLRKNVVAAPEFVWGAPEDLEPTNLESLKVVTDVSIALPAFAWGAPEDLDLEQVAILKVRNADIPMPIAVIGDPAEIDASELK